MSAAVAGCGESLPAVWTCGLPGVGLDVMAERVATAVRTAAESADQPSGGVQRAELGQVGCCVTKRTVSLRSTFHKSYNYRSVAVKQVKTHCGKAMSKVGQANILKLRGSMTVKIYCSKST